VTDVLRFSENQQLSRDFLRPPTDAADFVNNEKLLFVDSSNLLDFETGAEAAAALATGSDAALAAVYGGTDAAGFVRTVGRRALRRPLTPAEETAYGAIFTRGEELYGSGFAHGASLTIRALLESPYFLYRTELGPAGEALSGYEVASKLSFFLLDTTPSDALLDAAAAGELDTAQGLEHWARQMLDAPGAIAVMRDFHRQLFALDRAATIEKSGVTEFDVALLPELAAASTAFFDQIFVGNFGLREILTAKQAYVGAGLAQFYGMAAPASGLEVRELGASRSGYFMQVPFLMQFARGAESAPSRRGFWVQRMLCGPRPGPDVVATSPPQGNRTTREYMTELTAGCGGSCHAVMDPLGFAFENFDGLGREREQDNGRPVDTAGRYTFAEGVRDFADGNELVRIMADSMQAHTCYSKYVAGYALARDLSPEDRPLLEGLGKVSHEHSLRELVVSLVRDPAFRSRAQVRP
ncbi:MAG TPA: DUF1592 domain-containing protein, partial [Polyangiaceae bacterium]|nr:DUF1592 domain-containing protein [Polyangiaceae bacterium]